MKTNCFHPRNLIQNNGIAVRARYLLSYLWIGMLLSCGNNVKEYYSTGELKATYTIKNGSIEGIYYEYYQEGSIKTSVNYHKNIMDGVSNAYYPNGMKRSEGLYKNGVEQGIWKYYYDNGNVELLTNSKDGKLKGEIKEYDKAGSLNKLKIVDGDSLLYKEEYSRRGILGSIFRQIKVECISTVKENESLRVNLEISGPISNAREMIARGYVLTSAKNKMRMEKIAKINERGLAEFIFEDIPINATYLFFTVEESDTISKQVFHLSSYKEIKVMRNK